MLYRFGRFEVDAAEFLLRRDGEAVPLEPKVLHLLLYLVARPGRLVRKQQLLDELWPDIAVTDNALTRSVALLRRALGDDSRTPACIETVPRVGYRFIAPVCVVPADGDVNIFAKADTPSQEAAVPGGNAAAPQVLKAVETSANTTAQGILRELNETVTALRFRSAPQRTSAGMLLRLSGAVLAGALLAVTLWLPADKRWHGWRASSASGRSAPAVPVAGEDVPAEAQEEYRRGLFLYDRRNGLASAVAFRKAIELAPGYASAHAGLAMALDSQVLLSRGVPGSLIPEAIASAKRAIALNPAEGDAYIALGSIQTAFTWEWQAGEQNLREGIRLSPQNPAGHLWLALLLQCTDRPQESAAEAQEAVAAAPLSFFVVRMQASMLYYARRYDSALRVLERAREMQPQHPNVVDNWVSWIDEQRGLYDEAVAHDLRSQQGEGATPRELALLRAAYRRSSWQAYWQQRIEQMSQAQRSDCGLYFFGVALLRTGDTDRALEALHQAAQEHCFWMAMVRVDPAFDPLRDDPRFQSLQRSILYGAVQSPTVDGRRQIARAR